MSQNCGEKCVECVLNQSKGTTGDPLLLKLIFLSIVSQIMKISDKKQTVITFRELFFCIFDVKYSNLNEDYVFD